MIRRLEITGLKRFENMGFDLAPLTVLTGLNGSGKTTFIHALLLMREALLAVGAPPIVGLNGPYGLELGTLESIQNWSSLGDIRIGAETDSIATAVVLGGRGTALHAAVKSRSLRPAEFGEGLFAF